MTCETGQMSVRLSVRPCLGGNIFETLRLRDRWTDVDETWHVYSMGLWTKLLGSGILNFAPKNFRSASKCPKNDLKLAINLTIAYAH